MGECWVSKVASFQHFPPARGSASLEALLYFAVLIIFFTSALNLGSRGLIQEQAKMQRHYTPKYFFIDTKGKMVIDASKYQRVLGFSEGLAAVRSDQGWGFIDSSGKEAINAQFDSAGSFSEGLAAVEVEGLWGFIDRQGRIMIQPQYESANPFSDGIAVVIRSKSPNASHAVKELPLGSTVVTSRVVERKRVLVGGSGGNLFDEQTAQADDKEVLLIDRNDHPILSRKLSQLSLNVNGAFSEGLIEAYDQKTHKFGFVDKTGTFIIEPTFEQVAPFSEGLARVAIADRGEEKVGFIDHSGRFVIPPSFNTDAEFRRNSTDFSEGLASLTEGLRPTVTEEAKFVYLDKQGAIVLTTSFSYANGFHEGLASVYDSEKEQWGFINKSGKVVIPIKYDSASDFSDGLASVGVLMK